MDSFENLVHNTANETDGDEMNLENLPKGVPDVSLLRMSQSNSHSIEDPDSNGKDITQLSRKFQISAFINDLQHGLSFSNALTRLQTMKALMEQLVSEAIENNVESDDDFEDAASHLHNHSSNDCSQEDTTGDEPKGIIPVSTPKTIPTYNDVVIPQDKDPRTASNDPLGADDELDEDENSIKSEMDDIGSSRDDFRSLESLTTISSHEKQDHTALRSRINQIRALDVEPKQKAMMIQKLMMGKYSRGNHLPEIAAYGSDNTHDNTQDIILEDSYSSALATLSENDKKPVYHSDGVLGCPHYQRACKLQCNICHKWAPCRFCHDEEQQGNPNSAHLLERKLTRWIMCMRCQNVQRPTKDCEKCGQEFALYFCDKCKLYDNDELKDIYHCDKCGICRLGLGLGIDFFHCDGCQACLSIELQDNHKCIERATMSNCPICGDYMFTSVKPVVYMSPCGHAIHQHCFDEYTKHSYKCPHCQVTVLNMDAQFRVLDKEIEEQPLPDPYCHWMCIVSCNDCKGRSKCPYHILGLKCGHCLSYNTTQVKLIKPGTTGDEDMDPTVLEQFNHSMNHSLSENMLRDHFQKEDISPLINMDNSMMSNIDQYMNAYFKDEKFTNENKERHNVNDFINTNGLFSQDRLANSNDMLDAASQSMRRVSSLTEKFKHFIGDNSISVSASGIPMQRSISDVFQMWRQDSNSGEAKSESKLGIDPAKNNL